MRTVIGVLLFSAILLNAQQYLTIYNEGFSNIKSISEIELKKGINYLNFDNLSDNIIANSFLLNINAKLKERTINLPNFNKIEILKKNINANITLQNEDILIEGTLIDILDEMILIKNKNGQYSTINNINDYVITFNDIPQVLMKSSSISFAIESDKSNKEKYEISYLTRGLNWNANYIADYNPDKNIINLQGFFNINNNDDISYKDVNVRFIAGKINQQLEYDNLLYSAQARSLAERDEGYFNKTIEPESMGTYYAYQYPEKITIEEQQKKSFVFLNANNIKVKSKKVLKIYRADLEDNFMNILEFENKKENNLGIPLPNGVISVYQNINNFKDFAGESKINNTPSGETIQLNIAKDFDLLGKTTVLNQLRLNDVQTEIELEIILKNRKDKNENVEVIAYLGRMFEIVSSSENYEKIDKSNIKFNLNLDKNSEKKINLKYRSSW